MEHTSLGPSLALVLFSLLQVCQPQSASLDLCVNVVADLDCSQDPPQDICGTDGITYPTSCDFAKAHCLDLDLHIKYKGPCVSVSVPDPICKTLVGSICPVVDNPVCASDQNTYSSFCLYEQAKCLQPGLVLTQLGPCPTLAPTSPPTTLSIFELICNFLNGTDCPKGQPQVCGSDGVTYDSGCDLEIANCQSTAGIILISEGQC